MEYDGELWKEFIRGKDWAWKAIYEQHAPHLYSLGMQYCRDGELVKDCMQDLFLDLLRYRSGLAADVHVKYYLFQAFRRKIFAALRKRQAIPSEGIYSESFPGHFRLEPSFEDRVIREEHQGEVRRKLSLAISHLTGKQQEILYFRFNQSLSYPEIALILGISEESCRKQVYRAVLQLKRRLKKDKAALLLLLFL